MEVIQFINCVILLLFFSFYAYQFAYIPISLFRKPKPQADARPHRYAVLIAARNEEHVIGNLIDSLKEQTYPAELFSVYVAADNCTDRTAEVAEAHGAVVYERFDRKLVGKGYALRFLLEKIPESYDAYIVFDADNIVDKNYISEINKTFSSSFEIITGYRNSKNYGDNWISAGYGLWFLREARYLNCPRSLVGSSCGVSGTGFLFSDRVLKKCGGWNFFLLTEDIEFAAHSIVSGEKIGYCPTAVFYDEQPTSFRQSVRQRMRWVQGYLQVLRKYGTALLRGCFRGDFSCFDMLMNIAPAALLSWISIVVNLAAAGVSLRNGTGPLTVLLSAGQNLLGLCLTVFLLGLITTITEWKHIECGTGRKILSIFTFPVFMLTYIPISVAAFLCKPGWKPIVHSRAVSIRELQCESAAERRFL
ncbi:MAG: glycosyltransferase family 2 protein [Lachnospiraceae bacterium]|nr:glycosyltransferase family 2 protein [Lachnospiraceae bacterium]